MREVHFGFSCTSNVHDNSKVKIQNKHIAICIDQLLNVSVAKDTAVNEDTPTPQPEGVLEALGVERMDWGMARCKDRGYARIGNFGVSFVMVQASQNSIDANVEPAIKTWRLGETTHLTFDCF